MIVKKITSGFVVQIFDTEKNEFISQDFIAGDTCEYEDSKGSPVDEETVKESYLPFFMVQPDKMNY